MSGILKLESLTKGNTLKQGDKTPLKYRLFDADGEKLNIAGKSAKVRLVYPDFLTIGYEKDGLTVAQDDTVTFTIDNVIPSRIYHVEIIVDDQFIFPSRADESKFTVDKSSLGTETNIIEIVGKDILIQEVKSQVDTELQPLVTSLESAQQAELERVEAEQERVQGYQEIQQIFEDGAVPADGSVTTPKYSDGSVTPRKTTFVKTKNLFDGVYTKGAILTGSTELSFSTNYPEAISVIKKIDPDTTYTISKASDSDRFNIATFTEYPINQMSSNRNIKTDGFNTPTTFTTTSDEQYVVIYVSTSGASKEPSWLQIEFGSIATDHEEVTINLSPESFGNIMTIQGQEWNV